MVGGLQWHFSRREMPFFPVEISNVVDPKQILVVSKSKKQKKEEKKSKKRKEKKGPLPPPPPVIPLGPLT